VTPRDSNTRGPLRFNLVDVVAAIVIFGLIPIAYGAYLLFRTPPPTLVSVSPVRLFEGHNQRLVIDGANLRPFLRVSFNATQAKSFLIGSTKYAIVDLPDLKPGEYDVVLYDAVREVARLPKGLTVVPMAADVELEVVGAFKPAPAAASTPPKIGDKFPPTGDAIAEVIAIGAPTAGDLRLRVGDDTIRVPLRQPVWPATLRVKCYTARRPDGAVQCLVPGRSGNDDQTVIAPDALLTLASLSGPIGFQIDAVRPPAATSASPGSPVGR
jgi:hypothetical protein